jgi:hypothetical protein
MEIEQKNIRVGSTVRITDGPHAGTAGVAARYQPQWDEANKGLLPAWDIRILDGRLLEHEPERNLELIVHEPVVEDAPAETTPGRIEVRTRVFESPDTVMIPEGWQIFSIENTSEYLPGEMGVYSGYMQHFTHVNLWREVVDPPAPPDGDAKS